MSRSLVSSLLLLINVSLLVVTLYPPIPTLLAPPVQLHTATEVCPRSLPLVVAVLHRHGNGLSDPVAVADRVSNTLVRLVYIIA